MGCPDAADGQRKVDLIMSYIWNRNMGRGFEKEE